MHNVIYNINEQDSIGN